MVENNGNWRLRYARRAGVALVVASMLVVGANGASAQDSVPVSAVEGGTLWFVELSGPPTADGASRNTVQAEKAAFRAAAAAAGITYVERRAFDVLFNGFSIEIDAVQRAAVARLPGVRAIYPVEVIAAPRPEEIGSGDALDLASALTMTGANVAQNSLGLSGAGIRVGIIDTGIDIDHSALGGGGVAGNTPFPSARVVAGYDFVGNVFTGGNTPVPDSNPDDCNGHGTHVAGIVGANSATMKGVAPNVLLGAYRVFGCTGSTNADIMIAAMEMALADGMQVVNQSIGSRAQWPQYPTAQASTRMVNKGIVMVASIGNNGPGGSQPDGLFAAGAPGVGRKVVGVASFDNGQRSFTVNGTPYGYNAATGAPLPPVSGSLTMARTGTTTTANDACAALPAGSLAGRAVLIRRGTCTFYLKAINAQNAGAAAVVLYNNAAGALGATVVGTPPVTIPVVGITAAQGATLDAAIAAGPTTTLTWTGNYVSFPFGTGGLISGFSSFGLPPDLSFKPSLGAPGGAIFSTFPLEQGGSATLSGTSMSSPHVAGGVALMLEAKPRTSSNGMLARLQNAADPKPWSGNAASGLVDHAFRQGAGMLDIVGMVQATTVIEPSQLTVGESAAGPRTFTLAVKNDGAAAVTYDLAHVAGVAAGPNTQTGTSYAPSGIFDAPASVAFSAPSVSVPAGGTANVSVTIDANPALPNRALYGGYLTFTPQGGGASYSVPFAGFKGDYQSTQVVTPTARGFPWLAQQVQVGGSFFNRPNGATYTMQGVDVPQVLLHLDHPSRRVRFEAFDAATGQARHVASNDEYVTRNSSPTGAFAFPWDGQTFTGKGKNANQIYTMANGQYILRLSVLKALGDEGNPAHWETWTSPVITIARP